MMIEDIKDLELAADDSKEDVAKKVQDKLGVSLEEIQECLTQWLSINAEVLASELMNIAPNGNYEDLIEDAAGMAEFLKSGVKTESWEMRQVNCLQKNLLQFEFLSNAVDEGDTFKGFVFVTFSGKILHGFCTGDN
jgi:hypothetical protein